MSLVKFFHRYDFGHDWCVQILNVKGLSLLQASISWDDLPSSPFILVQISEINLFDLQTIFFKLGFDVTILGKTWRRRHHEEE